MPRNTRAPARSVAPTSALSTPSVPYWYSGEITGETFDLEEYFGSIPNFAALVDTAEGRRALTRNDPVLFAILYLRHHITAPGTRVPTFADPHFEWARYALTWINHRRRPPGPQEDRRAYVAPRECGKSTWWFLIIPMWAAAHQHKTFVAAFASADQQSTGHLKTFRLELEKNELLRYDYPQLTSPQVTNKGQPVADRDNQFNAANGFVFVARGIDSSNLGLKVENKRPDLLLMDDIEPNEAQYSPELAKRRLNTMLDAIFPMNIRATVIVVGTTVMYNSIVHQLVRSSPDHPAYQMEDWITDNNIKVHHTRPITTNPQNNKERSIWPSKWPLPFLKSIEHTRSYHKNYENDPRQAEGAFWTEVDIQYKTLPYTTRTALFIDPRVKKTTTKRTDYTGIAVVSWMPPGKARRANKENFPDQPFPDLPPEQFLYAPNVPGPNLVQLPELHHGYVQIEHAEQVTLVGKPLFKYVLKLLQLYPKIQRVVIETNQGGDLWLEAFDGLPVPIETHFSTEAKPIRFADALEFYQKTPSCVYHIKPLPALEQQYLAYPNVDHDDVADAAVAGVLYFLKPTRRPRARITATSYI